MKRLLLTVIIASMVIASSISALEYTASLPAKNYKAYTGLEQCPELPEYPSMPGAALWIDTVGVTYYDYQTNGSSGDRIIYHDDGSVHVSWMKLFSWPYPQGQRHIFYSHMDTQGNWGGEMQVSQNSPAGYCQMSKIYGNRAAIVYHETGGTDPTYVTLAIEWEPGLGFFDYYDVPDELYPQTPDSPGRCYWPYTTVDTNDNIHIMMTENTDRRLQRMAYTRSEDGGSNWTDLALVDTVMVISSVLDASPVSDKVVVAYCDPFDTTSQWKNDVVYYESYDGYTWNWRYGKINVTDYANDDDSLWAYTDCDVIIDYNDDIHLVWNASRITSDDMVEYKTFLFHYCDATEEITEITHHPDSLFADICGAWNRPICKMSLSCSPADNNAIAVSWTQFDTSDVSASGYGNGDIWTASSFDNGASWPIKDNATNTHSPGCYPGECMSEHWGTYADDVLFEPWNPEYYLTYILDRDAGAVIQEEGIATENLVIRDIFSSLDESSSNPGNYSISQNYPNPFNASTTISFTIEKPSRTTIDIFDITGARVCKLLDRELDTGEYKVTWNAEKVASGVYFYQISTEDHTETRRAIMIK